MKSKNENPTAKGNETQNNKNPLIPMSSRNEAHQVVWNALNFTTVALATSASIVAVQSPMKTLLLNVTKNGALMPGYTGGTMGLVRALYAGTSASLSGSAVRTVYVTGAKNNKPVEEITDGQVKEHKVGKVSTEAKLGYVVTATLGDIAVTQIPESISQLKKIPGLLPADFKWRTPHNARQLMAGGFAPRFMAGMVNFSCLCLVEDEVSRRIPIQNAKTKHFVAGAVSGMTAALFSYPFAVFKDYTLVQTQVNNGLLKNKSSIAVMKEMIQTVRSAPVQSTISFFKNAAKQMPMRMALT